MRKAAISGMHRRLWLVTIVVLSLFTLHCARDYVTGKRTFTLLTEADEIALGREADPQILAEFGVYDDPKLTAYVDQIGQAIAGVSHRPNLKYTFRVVDSPVVNAFALPGGWVYFTRGILAHFNSEAELAGVMGHEVGHIVARHGAEQISRAQLAGLAIGLGAALSPEFRKFSKFAEVGVGLLFLKFSRDQESESDRLGVEYATRLGYNAHEMANFFKTIARLSEKSGATMPTFLSTHPNPRDREKRIHALTREWQQKIEFQPKNVRRIDYLRRIDGIVYGEDPRQGFVESGMFYHPQMRFQFPVPERWQVKNSPASVQLTAPRQAAAIQLSLAKAATPEEAARRFTQNSKAAVLERRSMRIHGFPAVRLQSQVISDSDTLRVLSHFIQKEQTVFVFHGFTTHERYTDFRRVFSEVARGFDRLRNQAALRKKPWRVRIRKVNRAGTLQQVLSRYRLPGDRFEEIAILNGLELGDRVQAGQWIKIIEQK